MMKHSAIAAFLLLLLANAAFADEPETCGAETLLEPFAFSFISAAIVLVSAAVGLAYMASKIREDPRLSLWAKDEAYNLIITAFLFAATIAFVAGACQISAAYSEVQPFEAASNYIDALTANSGLSLVRSLTLRSINDQLSATKYKYFGAVPIGGSGAGLQAAYRAHSAQKEILIDLYMPILASLQAQKFILQGIEWVSLSVLLPFAFILRIIPFTREYGNIFLALFFALYVIVPTMYVMSAEAFSEIVKNPGDWGSDEIFTFNTYTVDAKGAIYGETVLYKIGSTIPQAVFIPNIVMIVAVTAAISLSKGLRALAV
jgi:hypothetical protein